jgi:glycosyltransferase involved in cell wall biosynthesis
MEKQLSVLVALVSGNLSGVETYAEQIAATGAAASHKVTLVALGAELADKLSSRAGSSNIRVVATDPLPRAAWRSAARQLPSFSLMEAQALLEASLKRLGKRFDVAHLNHPALATAARPYADRVVVGGWFYPHNALKRMVETWRHTGAVFPKSAAFALKGLSHYWNDRKGYSASDCVVAPTELLAAHLEAIGIHAIACPPPGRRVEADPNLIQGNFRRAEGRRQVTVISGNLAHPRKNVKAAIRAVGLLARSGMKLNLELIGHNADALAAELNALPPSVHVLAPGALPREEVDERLRSTDLLVVPSLYEEWGYVATEAALSGTPVVAFPVYPFVEILAAPLGLCAQDMSSDALARALAHVLLSEGNRAAVSAAAERRFGTETVGQRLSEIWSGVPAGPVALMATAGGQMDRP